MKTSFRSIVMVAILLASGGIAAAAPPKVIDTWPGGGTRFKVESVRLGKQKERRVGWFVRFFVAFEFAEYHKADVLHYQIKLGGKKIGEPIPCTTAEFRDELEQTSDKGNTAPKKFKIGHVVFKCEMPQDRAIEGNGGEYAFELSYQQTLADHTYKAFDTLYLKVLRLMQGQSKDPDPWYAQDEDWRLGVATIYALQNNDNEFWSGLRVAVGATTFSTTPPTMFLSTWFKMTADNKIGKRKMTCFLGDKKVGSVEASEHGAFQARSFPSKGKDIPAVETSWVNSTFAMPWQPAPRDAEHRSPDTFYLSENPGSYRCAITAEGEIVKEVFFEVGKNGDIVAQKCWGKINALAHTALLTVRDRKIATTGYDKQATTKRSFYRVKWDGCPPPTK